ncbi:hypothetical protein [Pseudomonas amygdali]|nr:hypothetical protein [Pseudomonas amygdali]
MSSMGSQARKKLSSPYAIIAILVIRWYILINLTETQAMQKSEIAQRLAKTNETEAENSRAEIGFNADLKNLSQQQQDLMKELQDQFGVSSLEELRTLYSNASKEDERAVSERETLVTRRKEIIDSVRDAVNRVNAPGSRG